jgi:sugar phosphate permease
VLTAATCVPAERRSTAVGVVTAASYLGTALAFGLSPTIIDSFGWPVRRTHPLLHMELPLVSSTLLIALHLSCTVSIG